MNFQPKICICTNCGVAGHTYKHCHEPITSYGTILFRVRDTGWNQARVLASQPSSMTGFEQLGNKLEILLIQRRDSLGFVEIMRGKYNIADLNYIRHQLTGMTKAEQQKILTRDFDELWTELWGTDGKNGQFRIDKENARNKFYTLRNSVPSMAQLVEECPSQWDTPEWGFPKGRREAFETDLDCALREMEEETGLRRNEVMVIQNLHSLNETFFGSNHVHYCHKYFVVYVPKGDSVRLDLNNIHMKREIGDIRWFSLEEGLQRIRPENTEKREMLLRFGSLLRNFCPLLHAPK